MTERSVFLAALDIPDPQARAAYLDQACAGDPALRQEVEDLLAVHARPGSFLAGPAAGRPWDCSLTADEVPPEGPGSRIGPYRLLEQIGEGGMGVVYMAEQEQPVRRKVALKIIKPGLDSQQVVARFEAERQALGMMDHPNIARVYDAGTTSLGRPYFVMELIHGVSITTYCDENRLTPRERLQLFIPVCQAIQHAHQKGVIHRDIKPSNVLVTLYDGKPVPKVIDFGVAKAVEQRLTDRTLFTRFGALVGTFEYMSPEQAEMNALGVDTRSDVYSLGVLLYELLTGTTPLERQRVKEAAYGELVRLIKEEEPPRPSVRLSTTATLAKVAAARRTDPGKLSTLVRGELDWIVMKALEKDRSRRYDTATGLAQDVQRYLQSEPVLAGPPSATYVLRKLVQRHRAVVLTTTLVVLALVIGLAGAAVGLVQALQSERDAVAARDEAVQMADANTRLAQEKDALARTEQRLRQAAEWQAVQLLFEQSHARCVHEDAALGLLSLAHTLEEAVRIGASDLEQSARLHLGAWQRQVYPLRAVLPHDDAVPDGVHAVAFSPDGKVVATGCSGAGGWVGGEAWRWDAATGRPLGPPLRHRGPVHAVAFSPDGKLLATGIEYHEEGKIRGEVRFWDALSGVERLQPLRHDGAVTALAFGPDSTTLLTGVRLQFGGGQGRLWDVATGKPLGPPVPHRVGVEAVAVAPDGRTFALAGVEPQVWEVGSWKAPRATLQKHFKKHTALAYHPRGETLLTAGHDTTALLWDAGTGRLLGPLLRHPTGFRSAVYSRDGRTIVTACCGRTARLWDAATGLPLGPPLRHPSGIHAAAISPDGQAVVTVGEDRAARVWDVAADWLPAPVAAARVWDMNAGRLPAPVPVPLRQQGKGQVRLLEQGRLWAVLSWEQPEGPVLLAGPDGKSLSSPLSWEQALGPVLAFSPDGALLVTANAHSLAKAQVWDAATGLARGPLLDIPFGQVRAAFSPDNRKLFLGSDGDDRAGMLWDVETGQPIGPPLRRQENHDAGVRAAAFRPDGRAILLAGDGMVQLREVGTWKPLGNPFRLSVSVQAMAFRPDGQAVVLGAGAEARLWDVATGKPLGPPLPHQGSVMSVAFTSDGAILLTGSEDQTARLWEAATGKPLGPPLVHDAEVAAVAISPDARIALTASKDQTVRLWEVATGKALGPPQLLHPGGWVTAAAFGPGGKTFLTGTPAHVWETPGPIAGDVAWLRLWAQVRTGLELDEHRTLRVLSASTWQQRKHRLQALGAPARPGRALPDAADRGR